VLQAWASVAHPKARGVKCALRAGDGRVLFVRHGYGNRRQWEIPGGGARPGEALAHAARREAFEELGADIAQWEQVGVASGDWYGRDQVLTVFAARWPGGPVRADPVEIAAAGWFSLDRPPEPLGPTTVAALRIVRDG
jgi:8-oxo-dGTP diphosphatase